MSPSQQLRFLTLDLFTTSRLEGNPLAVIMVPRGSTLSQQTKQLIAREFNFSETVFLHEMVGGDSEKAPHRADIFTTTEALPFAGHPTIGSACVVLSRSSSTKATLLVKAGPIPIELLQNASEGFGVVRAFVPHDIHIHSATLRTTKAAKELKAAKILGYGNTDTEQAELDAPVVSIVKGMAFLLGNLPTKIRARMVSESVEDPATGSAACTLASYLSAQWAQKASSGSVKAVAKYEILQGVEMGRRSKILVDVQIGADQMRRWKPYLAAALSK